MTHLARRPRFGPAGTSAQTATPGSARPVILFVSPVADLKGGAERVLLDLMANPAITPALAVPGEGQLAAVARDRGYKLHVFDLGRVATVRRPPRPGDLAAAAWDGLACARQLARISREVDAALVHTNGLKVHVIGALARVLGRVPVVAHVHDIPHTRLEKAIWHGIGRVATRTVVVSAPCFPAGPLPARVAVVSNGLPVAPGPAVPRSLPAMPTVGFVGRFHPFKGLHVLLDWFEHASASRPSLRLLIRGRADEEGAAYWAELQDRIAPLVEQGRCQVLGWAEAGEDPYAGIDVLAVPSRTPDPAPLVVLEAMARGIPVVGYPAGGIPSLIGGPQQGALASNGPEFVAALDRILEPGAYRSMSEAGIRRVRDGFTLQRFWDGITAQYRLAGMQG